TSGRKTATTQALLRLASPIESEWLTPTHAETIHRLDPATGTVKATEVDWYHALPLREHPIAPEDERRIDLLVEAWLARDPDEDSQRLLRRLEFAGMAADAKALARE